LTRQSSVYSETDGHGELQNLGDFAAVSHGIVQTGPWSLAKFSAENCAPYWFEYFTACTA